MTKITLTDLANLQNETTAVNAINSNNEALTAELNNTLSRDGSDPNQMEAVLDMNSHAIINLPAPLSNFEPLRAIDVGLINGGGITVSPLPGGGNSGQVLKKNSGTSADYSWKNDSFGVDVTDYGAKGDATTNDQTAITNAIAAAVAANSPLVFPPGIYTHNSVLDFSFNGLEVIFLGKVRLQHTGTGINVQIDAGNGTPYTVLTNIKFGVDNKPIITGNLNTSINLFVRSVHHSDIRAIIGDADSVAGTGFRNEFAVCSNFEIFMTSNDFPISNVPANGVIITRRLVGEGPTDSKYNLILEGLNNPLAISYSDCNVFTGVSEASITGHGVYMLTCNRNTFLNFFTENNNGNGFWIQGQSSSNVFINCTATDDTAGYGFFLDVGAQDTLVIGSTFKSIFNILGAVKNEFFHTTYDIGFTDGDGSVIFNSVRNGAGVFQNDTTLVNGTKLSSGQYPGETTTGSATAGNVGEYVSGTGSGAAMSSGVAGNVAQIVLTAGDWDVSVLANFLGTGTTTWNNIAFSISTVSGALDATPGRYISTPIVAGSVLGSAVSAGLSIPSARISIAVTTTLYLVGLATFGTSTMTASGIISARRAR